MIQAVILVGGMGTRLRSVTGDLPKPLAQLNGEPLLEHQLFQLASAGIKDAVLLSGYAGDQITDFCGDGSKWNLSLRCIREDTPSGTAGAVLNVLDSLDRRFMVIYGDLVFEFDAARFISYHDKHGADATLFLHPNDHPHDSDLVEVDEGNRIIRFHVYPHPPNSDLPNLVNAGIYIIERPALSSLISLAPKPDFAKHIFPLLLERGGYLLGYRSPEYVKDAGTPERLEKTAKDLRNGRVAGASLRKPAPAVFMDRDGTLIRENGYIRTPQEVALLPGVGKALGRLNQSKYRTVVVTNQPVIARGECDEEGLRRIHNRLDTLLGSDGAYIDALYFCPHHPDSGFPGERAELKKNCDCRKPGTGLVLQAKSDLNLDLSDSWLIGDTTSDVMTARRAGVRSILLHTGEAGRDNKWQCSPDFECPSIVEAVDLITRQWDCLRKLAIQAAFRVKDAKVVLVGGLTYAGKSTFSSALALCLRESGRNAIVLPLEIWQRGNPSGQYARSIDQYDFATACYFITHAARVSGMAQIPSFRRVGSEVISTFVEVDLSSKPILIIDGGYALADSDLRSIASYSFFIDRPEEERISALKSFLTFQGLDVVEGIGRMSAEIPLVSKTSKFANLVIKGIDHDCLQNTAES